MKQKTAYFTLTALGVALLSACGTPPKSAAGSSAAAPTYKIQAVNSTGVDAAQAKAVEGLVQATAKGELAISASPTRVLNSGGLSANDYDAAMNAIKNNHGAAIQNLGKLDGVAAYDLGGAGTLYLRDPNAAGLKHSAIGHVFNATGDKDAYVSIGASSAPEKDATVQADYTGALIGTYDGTSEVVADVAAKLDWSPAVKTLVVNVTNAHVSTDNMKSGGSGYQEVQANNDLNFNRTLVWNNGTSGFVLKDVEGETRAQLYGSAQEEVGGTFDHTVGGKAYSGAFFGRKP